MIARAGQGRKDPPGANPSAFVSPLSAAALCQKKTLPEQDFIAGFRVLVYKIGDDREVRPDA